MTSSGGAGDLSSIDAFGLLTNDTRIDILLALWRRRGPQTFSELQENAGVEDPGNFNYHLEQLRGTFLLERDEGYDLTRAGRRALTAIFAEDITALPTIERTQVDRQCPFCGSSVELVAHEDDLRIRCPTCPGSFEVTTRSRRRDTPHPSGTISVVSLPTGGVRDRSPNDLCDVGTAWTLARATTYLKGICPDCSGEISTSPIICSDHESDGICTHCGTRFLGRLDVECGTCLNGMVFNLSVIARLDATAVAYFDDHGYDLLDPGFEDATVLIACDERLHSTDPLDYEANWTLDGETLRVRCDDRFHVTESTRHS